MIIGQKQRVCKGFSLVEAMLSVALLGMIALGVISSVVYGQESTALSGERFRALLYAQEGLDVVRNLRDSDPTTLMAGTYGLANSGGEWSFSGSSDIQGNFTRTVTITEIDSTKYEIASQVNWDQNMRRSGEVVLETTLTRWQETSGGVLRAIEYTLGSGDFSGTTYDLMLDYDLFEDYFIIVEGSDGNGGGGGTRGPDENYIALVEDPFGTGDLGTSSDADVLSFERGDDEDDWRGVIKVVECLSNCDGSGFELLDVQIADHNGGSVSGSETVTSPWSDIDQVFLVGGYHGAGCVTSVSGASDTKTCHARIWPSGTDTINWTRDNGGANLFFADSTVMVVEWGDAWEVQRERVTGNNGGDGADDASEYESSSISSVVRENTWVWGAGHTGDNGIGDSAEGVLITLGNGEDVNAIENEVSAGMEYGGNDIDFEVYAMTHEDILVDYFFKEDGDGGNLTYTFSVQSAPETQARIALITNGSNGTGTAYPRPLWSSRYLDDTTIRLERRRSGQNWPAWVQGVDFSQVGESVTSPSDTAPPADVSDLSLSNPTQTSLDLSWTAPGDDGNSGTATSYDIRHSTSPLGEAQWASATQVSGEPTPIMAGSAESMTVSGLASGTQYYFAIKTLDEVGNISSISNDPNETTLSVSTTEADALDVDVSGRRLIGGNRFLRDIEIENTGSSSISLESMTVSWTGGSASVVTSIDIHNQTFASGQSSGGTTTTAITIPATTVYDLDFIRFDSSMAGSTLSLTFTMSDNSSKTVSGISL